MSLEDENSSLLEEILRILRERSRDETPPVLLFEDLVEEVISRGVLSPRSKAFIESDQSGFCNYLNLVKEEISYDRRIRRRSLKDLASALILVIAKSAKESN
jgi:hypothetical protein